MGIADARAMHPSIEIVEADPEADRRLLEALADWCDRYTPLVALDGTDGLFLDITGCAHLFGGEEAMLDDLARRLLRAGFRRTRRARLDAGRGLGGGALLGCRRSRSGEEASAALAPLAARRPPASMPRHRAEPGKRRPAHGRLGHGGAARAARPPLRRHAALCASTRRWAASTRPSRRACRCAPLSVERHLAEPIVLTEDIERLVLLLARRLKQDLERRGEGARRLQLLLFRVDGAVSRIAVGTSRPLREPPLIGRLFHERLAALEASIDAGYGFDLVRLSVLSAAALRDAQADLAGETTDDGEDLALFADRVRARLGDDAVLRPVLVESHLPERAVVRCPSPRRPETPKAGSPAARRAALRPERPLRLFRARSRSRCRRPKCRRARRCISAGGAPCTGSPRAEGPERIAPEWWRDEARGAATRDYFRVEDAGRPPLLALPRGPLRRPQAAAALVHARALRMNALAAIRLCRVRRPVEFLLPARRLEAGGTGGHGQAARPFRDRPCRPQHGCRRGARLAAGRRWRQSFAYHPGCRLVFCDGTPDILAYPQDRKGWGHLCRMLTQANLRDESEKGDPLLHRDDLLEWGDLLSLAVLPDLDGRPDDSARFPAPAQGPLRRSHPARRRPAYARQRPLPAGAGGSPRRRGRHAADGGQRRALPYRRNGARCRTC